MAKTAVPIPRNSRGNAEVDFQKHTVSLYASTEIAEKLMWLASRYCYTYSGKLVVRDK